MKCQTCKGQAKLYDVSAKCSDRYYQRNLKSGKEYDGYVPDWIGEWGDYVTFIICRHCGQVQGDWPNKSKNAKDKFKSGSAKKIS